MSTENLFEQLRKDHEMQRDVLDMIIETSGESEARKKMLKVLDELLTSHAKYEEIYFYAPLMEMESTHELARHSVAEHKDIDDLLQKLKDTDMSSSAWLSTAKELKHLVEHHLDEEEQEVFRPAGKFLAEKEKTNLAHQYRDSMQSHRDISI
ncbi:MAG: hemerythrin [Halobacteriovoraceae bacterium]|nr:hemerythrin [Halobacteriovoraceae bacterium]|tara:strand:+ start:470 stop:925 length:456 start_codon:yes stop_codon:yes gene_type:complete